MAVKFTTIRYKNFLSTGNEFLELDLNNFKNTLIVGKNGEGKSTMIDALCFALFGKAFRKVNKSGVMNSINRKECVVEVEFIVKNHIFKVVRGIKPNVFEIWQDGELIDQNSNVRDYQEVLDDITGLTYRTFTQNVVLGSASYVPFMQLKPAERREIVEDLLDIKIFAIMNEIAKKKMSDIQQEMSELSYKTDVLSKQINVQLETIERNKKNYDEMISDFESQIIDIDKNIESFRKDVNKINRLDVKPIKNKKNEFSDSLRKVEAMMYKNESRIKELDKLMKFLKNDKCPTCEQPMTGQNIKDKLASAIDESKQCKDNIVKFETAIKTLKQNVSKIDTMLEDEHRKDIKYTTLTNSIKNLENNRKNVERQIDNIRKRKIEFVDIKQLNDLQDEQKSLKDNYSELKDTLRYYTAILAMLKDDGVKSLIIKNYLPIMNERINHYLEKMDSFFDFELDENFNETIKSRYRDSFNYYNFSEGEKQRIDISLLLTWRDIARLKNSVSTNLLIMDEVFDSSLDASTIDRLMDILLEVEQSNIFVISHNTQNMIDKFERVLLVEKKDNFSQIEEYDGQ